MLLNSRRSIECLTTITTKKRKQEHGQLVLLRVNIQVRYYLYTNWINDYTLIDDASLTAGRLSLTTLIIVLHQPSFTHDSDDVRHVNKRTRLSIKITFPFIHLLFIIVSPCCHPVMTSHHGLTIEHNEFVEIHNSNISTNHFFFCWQNVNKLHCLHHVAIKMLTSLFPSSHFQNH